MKLLTTLYHEAHPERARELIECLQRNGANPAIDQIHVFYDSAADQGSSVVRQAVARAGATVREIRGRPTYADFFRYANEQLAGQIVVLANADIHFNQTLALLDGLAWDRRFLAITRDDFVGTHGEGSADVWVFRAPVPLFGQNVTFGTVCCDQVISYLARKNGLRVDNPCLSIHCLHRHQSGVRNRRGTKEHRTGQSTSSDGLGGMAVEDLHRQLVRDHGIRLMAFSGLGGGMVWPSKLVAGSGPNAPKFRCRKVLRWQPLQNTRKLICRTAKSGIRQALQVTIGTWRTAPG